MKGQPQGLIAAALANMGERFGFYIMMAILTLFISAKFGLDEATAGYIYSGFYASIYLLALVGGIIADKTKNYKGTIMWGLVVMSLGYLLIAIPTPTPVPSLPLYLTLTCLGLLVIAFGNGLFKGNLQALVGQMYDNKEFSAKRESGFQIFYMFINIGGFFAPFVACATGGSRSIISTTTPSCPNSATNTLPKVRTWPARGLPTSPRMPIRLTSTVRPSVTCMPSATATSTFSTAVSTTPSSPLS